MLTLNLEPHHLAVCQLLIDASNAPLTQQLMASPWCCVLRTGNELSLICLEHEAPQNAKVEPGWRSLRLQGPFPFTMTGVLASVLEPLAQAQIGIFALSTFDTDHVLIKDHQLEQAVLALRQAGHTVNQSG